VPADRPNRPVSPVIPPIAMVGPRTVTTAAETTGSPTLAHLMQTVFDVFCRGAFDAGLQARILHPGRPAATEPPPVLVAPAYYAADDTTLDHLLDYAEAGGHLILGPRTTYADHEARARTDAQPARLAEAAGVTYD